MLLTARFNQIDSKISAIESQIAQLQAQLSELQNHRQHLQSVEQACESALSQVDTALMMLNHVDPECVAVFKDAISAKFEGEVPLLNSFQDEEIEPNNTIDNPTGDITNTLDIDVNSVDIDANSDEPLTNADINIALEGIQAMTINELKEFVRKHYTDEFVKENYGNLKRRVTWEYIAEDIINNSVITN